MAIIVAAVVASYAGTFGWGYVKGDTHRATLDHAAEHAAQVEFLQQQVAAAQVANVAEAKDAAADKAELQRQVEVAKNALSKVSNGICLNSGDVDQLRAIWPRKHGH